MKFVTNLCAKTVILLVPAKISYLPTLYYQATNASNVQCCSTQTDRQYLATAPGDKKNDTAVPGDKNCSCQL